MAGTTTWELDDQAFAGARAPHYPTTIEWQGHTISVFFSILVSLLLTNMFFRYSLLTMMHHHPTTNGKDDDMGA
jgi:hypothetical protein